MYIVWDISASFATEIDKSSISRKNQCKSVAQNMLKWNGKNAVQIGISQVLHYLGLKRPMFGNSY